MNAKPRYEWTLIGSEAHGGEHQAETSMQAFMQLLADDGFESIVGALRSPDCTIQLRRIGPGTVAEANAVRVDNLWRLEQFMTDWCGGMYKTPARLSEQFANAAQSADKGNQ